MTASPGAEDAATVSLAVREPLQQRSKATWTRILDAGVTLLEAGGYEAFTIAAVCDRAHVAPPAVYARVDTKDGLFLAVYEHGMARVRADHAVLADLSRWRNRPADLVVVEAVREIAGIVDRHAQLLRAVVLLSGAHPEVTRRGALYSQELGEAFTRLLLESHQDIDQPDPEAAIRTAFTVVFSTLILRVAYGAAFTTRASDDRSFLDALATMARRYLLRP